MTPAASGPVNLAEVLSSLMARRVRVCEIIAALRLSKSTYYEQLEQGRLLSADNLLLAARALGLNPVELLLRCGLIAHEDVTGCAVRAPVPIPPQRTTPPHSSSFRRRHGDPPFQGPGPSG